MIAQNSQISGGQTAADREDCTSPFPSSVHLAASGAPPGSTCRPLVSVGGTEVPREPLGAVLEASALNIGPRSPPGEEPIAAPRPTEMPLAGDVHVDLIGATPAYQQNNNVTNAGMM